jgi:hypothetical protein
MGVSRFLNQYLRLILKNARAQRLPDLNLDNLDYELAFSDAV